MNTLYPQNNEARMTMDLGGVWDFRFKGDEKWQPAAVPASYNDQSPDPRFRNYAGITEYRRKITVPRAWQGMRVCLRFDAVAHDSRILLDGEEIATHRGGFLPFEVELAGRLETWSSTTTTRVLFRRCVRRKPPCRSVSRPVSVSAEALRWSCRIS